MLALTLGLDGATEMHARLRWRQQPSSCAGWPAVQLQASWLTTRGRPLEAWPCSCHDHDTSKVAQPHCRPLQAQCCCVKSKARTLQASRLHAVSGNPIKHPVSLVEQRPASKRVA